MLCYATFCCSTLFSQSETVFSRRGEGAGVVLEWWWGLWCSWSGPACSTYPPPPSPQPAWGNSTKLNRVDKFCGFFFSSLVKILFTEKRTRGGIHKQCTIFWVTKNLIFIKASKDLWQRDWQTLNLFRNIQYTHKRNIENGKQLPTLLW